MATNDTAALVVALSAQLTRFEKDMTDAVTVADKKTKEIENTFTRLNGAIGNKMQQLSSQLSGNLGFAGSILTSLGPAGIAAAVGIGTAVAGILALASATEQFSIKAKALKEGAETAGLTITQFKLLGQAGQRVGLDFDETTAFFTKFIANLEALRQGGGPLYEALLKIDTGLLRQLSTTKDSALAIDLLANAYSRLTDQTKRLDLARAAGGKAGLSGSRLLETLGQSGGVTGIVDAAPKIDEGQIERAAKLRVEIDAIYSKTANIWGGMFSDTILSQEKRSAEWLQSMAKSLADIVSYVQTATPAIDTFADRFNALPQPGRPRAQVVVNRAPEPPPTTPTGAGSPSVELAILQKNIALLGEGVTQGEQWRLKRLEIAAAAEKGGLMDGIAGRALAAFNVTMQAAALATRERLGVATEQQISETKLAQLAQDRVKYGLSENEVDRAKVIILREAKDAADALTVRQAYLPGLKQLELDSLNVRKNLDTLAVSTVDNLANAMVSVAQKNQTLGESFRQLSTTVIGELEKMIFKALIFKSLSGLGIGFENGGIMTSSGPAKFAMGGVMSASGPLPLKKYAGGGVATNPQMAIFGEGAMNEAFVPLPDGRSIPVKMKGGGGTNVSVSSVNNFSVGVTPGDMAQISQMVDAKDQRAQSDLLRAIRNGQQNDSSFLMRGA